MKLIKVEAHGFKSFADPISLRFDGGVAGIVGPNGSGKSNINDAIRWVLGERSAKELRGDKMDDVIFQGSQTAKPLDRAEVTLTFDNKDGQNSIPHEIFTISRVLERGNGTNKYYLNGEECRQKDILEIAMESGIGKSSLAIISQGTVSDIAQSTPEQRKAIFEEAAGVSKYKFKKKEALSKLAKTQEGLDQITLVIAEIERKLIPLRKQAEKAKIYITKTEELKEVEVGLLVHNIKTYGSTYESLTQELEGVSETKIDLEERIKEAEAKISQNTGFRIEEQKIADQLSKELKEVEERLRNIDLVLAKETARERLIAQGEIEVSVEERIKAFQKLAAQHTGNIKNIERQMEVLNLRYQENNVEIAKLDEEVGLLNIQKNKKDSDLVKVRTHLHVLEQQREGNTMLYKGTKTILENKAYFGKPLKGTVADLIKVDNEYLRAIDVILSSAAQHLVVDKSETAVKAVNFLKQNDGGRATFIPLSSIQPKSVRDDHLLAVQGHPGFVAVASELVYSAPEYEILKKFLLGNVIVASDIEQANKISNILERRYMIVTLEGDTIRAGGVIVGGAKVQTQSLLGFEEKIEELKKLIPGLNAQIQLAITKLNEVKNKRKQAFDLATSLQNEISTLKSKKINEQFTLDELNLKLSNLNARIVELSEEKESSLANSKADVELLNTRKVTLLSELNAKENRIRSLTIDLDQLNIVKNDYSSTLNKLIQSFAQKLTQKDKSKMLLDQSRERLASQYKMTFEAASEQYNLVMNQEDAEDFVWTLREEIDKLGSVNIESLETLIEEEARYNKLAEGERELSEAKQTLENAIADIDKVITTRLVNIVNDVNGPFNEVFATMLGGGRAELYWTDPNDILESGIEIKAQPPGKNIANLKLFSGGEKSLIAISLLFGILKARPLPLCILDEVEAALDEANVVRYAEYLQELKEKTQFIVITHRHGTMSRVDSLFGATMQNRGITTFFSLELAEAKKLVDDEQIELDIPDGE
ncbi:AAA family ATPase [Mycoplasma sp. ES3157-GEN-MYC]|uniref:Chromosome partition protein Smc n=1 Tax=Mycoplasma miroungigenitalium TaxID=754515 RepID=A0A6M4JAF1_9MOLU|nr:AAA family ATPase [Mycoplasma miroungigenitalium]MBU4690276.1 AAA family ATPase [Mycoplasma miroungigenitalium]MBU4691543.1 AAA family ATPase [Mycoplasma miroungigenitalium]QJR43375.1 AAA family ATPase [Mycoplasma miroungigenitalium]